MYLNNNISEIFIPIGSGNIQSPRYGFKAEGLDFATKNKISVPKGYLLSHEILRNFKHESLEINTLIKKIQELPIQNSFSIRSSFSIEDQKENSLATALNHEYKFRFDRQTNHKSYDLIKTLPIPQIKDYGLTPFVQAMPNQYKNENPITAYRDFYCSEKKNLLFWTKRMKPEWIKIN
jgi:hypothetical protein